jgi:tRNA/rRNA methyltransferase
VEAAREGKVALVFGREDNGLTNEELGLCMHIIRIPSSPAYKSLNVAQAAMVCCYEIFVASGLSEPRTEGSPEASADLRERMCAMWRETILKTGFVEENKADHMMYGLRRIFGRGALTVKDVNILMGVARQALWAAAGARGRKGGGSPGWPAKGGAH